MTKIVESWVKFRKEPLRASFSTSLRSVNELTIVEFHIKTDDGHEVFGETVETPAITGDTLAQIEKDLRTVLPEALKNKEFETAASFFNSHISKLDVTKSAKCAVDIALYDLQAIIENRTLGQLLGSSVKHVTTDVTIPLTEISAIPNLIAERSDFPALKIKLGKDLVHKNIEKIRLVREIIGVKGLIRVDPNQAWSVEDSIEFLHHIEQDSLDIEYLEQPISAHNKVGMAAIRAQCSTKIMADESIYTVADLEELVNVQAIDLVNVKIIKSGGITPSIAIIKRAKELGVDFSIGSMMEGDKGVLGAYLLAGAYKPDYCHDLDAAWWALSTRFTYVEGKVSI